jgi:hypothetical protein
MPSAGEIAVADGPQDQCSRPRPVAETKEIVPGCFGDGDVAGTVRQKLWGIFRLDAGVLSHDLNEGTSYHLENALRAPGGTPS